MVPLVEFSRISCLIEEANVLIKNKKDVYNLFESIGHITSNSILEYIVVNKIKDTWLVNTKDRYNSDRIYCLLKTNKDGKVEEMNFSEKPIDVK